MVQMIKSHKYFEAKTDLSSPLYPSKSSFKFSQINQGDSLKTDPIKLITIPFKEPCKIP
jgi:hypothetical protein